MNGPTKTPSKGREEVLANLPESVHLVGSIGLDSAQEVFRTVGKAFGRRLKRIPDGEPGPRRLWVSFQYPLLRSSPFLRPDPSGAVRKTSGFPLLCLAEGVAASEVRFGELGYAREARTSYQDFCAARANGEIPENVRFQVCLPTPMGVIYAFCTSRDIGAIEAAYEAAMIREVEEICRHIPHDDLCIQWDFCHEMILWDGQPQDMFPTINASERQMTDRIARICAPIPDRVELGFHLCYGDFGARHFIEPVDTTKMVEVMNAITGAVAHPIAYFHLPVPMSRNDDAFFKPLQELRLSHETEIYLGLVHGADSPDGTRRRIDVARKYIKDFGVATECGMARARTASVIQNLLDVHVAATQEPAKSN
jgi:methionine synthase II (cobalamin-independent)